MVNFQVARIISVSDAGVPSLERRDVSRIDFDALGEVSCVASEAEGKKECAVNLRSGEGMLMQSTGMFDRLGFEAYQSDLLIDDETAFKYEIIRANGSFGLLLIGEGEEEGGVFDTLDDSMMRKLRIVGNSLMESPIPAEVAEKIEGGKDDASGSAE